MHSILWTDCLLCGMVITYTWTLAIYCVAHRIQDFYLAICALRLVLPVMQDRLCDTFFP